MSILSLPRHTPHHTPPLSSHLPQYPQPQPHSIETLHTKPISACPLSAGIVMRRRGRRTATGMMGRAGGSGFALLSCPQTRPPYGYSAHAESTSRPPSFSHYCGDGRPRRRLFCPGVSRRGGGRLGIISPALEGNI